jgi:GMP synthase (glutamine-hydrolysing)
MRCIALRHLSFEDLGIFEAELRALGWSIDYRQAGVDAVAAQEWLAADLVVVLGGPIGAYELDRYPWLAHEIAHIGRRLQARRPMMGICLGAQLMASALGRRVHAGAAREIGWAEVTLSARGRASPLRHLAGVPVLHWHGDTFELPEGAELLASTSVTPHQAFSIGTHALALQFHPEVDAARIEAWLIGHTVELGAAGIDVSALREASRRLGAASAQAGRGLLREWLDAAFVVARE